MAENTAGKQRGKPFKPGQSGNPTGKPKGCRHRNTLAALALLDGEAEALTRRAVELALGGDIQALRLCLERIVAPTRDRPIKINIPAVQTALDLPRVIAAIMVAVASGEIGATEAATLARLVEAHGRAIETADLEARLSKLEAQEGSAKKGNLNDNKNQT